MDIRELIVQVARLRPALAPTEQLRMALLLAVHFPECVDCDDDSQELERKLLDITLRLNSVTDQHAAVADELDSLGATAPADFSDDHIWTLVRALRIQNQVIGFYLEPSFSEAL